MRISDEMSGILAIIIIIYKILISFFMARILIIDDESATADLISNLCRDRGHQPFHYNSSEAAINALPDIAPHLVIADVETERRGEFDILRECKESYPQTAVVKIVTYNAVRKAMKSGAFDYITKPSKSEELQFCIQRALDHQSSLRGSDVYSR